MELDIFEAFRAAGVPDEKARGAVEAIHGLIDRRYALHAEQLTTRADLERAKSELRSEIANLRSELRSDMANLRTSIADAKTELIRWSVGSTFASVGMFAAISRLLAH